MDITKPSPITTILRDAIKGIGGVLVGIGAVSPDLWTTVTGALMYIIPAIYAAWKQTRMANTA